MDLANRTDFASRVSCLAAPIYLLAFDFLGRPENFYRGLLYAPLLPVGIVAGWRRRAIGGRLRWAAAAGH